MARPKLNTPKYRYHKATCRGVVTLAGRDIYLPGKYGSVESRAAYARVLAEYAAGGGGKPRLKHERLTVTELIAAYWKQHVITYYRNPDGTPSKEQAGIKAALTDLRAIYGLTDAADFGPLALKAVRERMIERGLSRPTINKNMGKVKRAFAWAVSNEMIPATVLHGLASVRGLRKGRSRARETEGVKPVPDSIVDATLPHLQPTVRAMVELQRLTGMRSGELVIMRPCDLDTSGKIWCFTPTHHKTSWRGHERPIYLGPQAQDIIRPFLRRELTAFMFSPREAEAARRAVQHAARRTPLNAGNRPGTNRKAAPRKVKGARYTPQSYGKSIQAACDKAFPVPAGLDDGQVKAWRKEHRWFPHQLRHAAATRIRKEFGIEAARVVLGHTSAAVTEIYAEIDRTRAADIMARVG